MSSRLIGITACALAAAALAGCGGGGGGGTSTSQQQQQQTPNALGGLGRAVQDAHNADTTAQQDMNRAAGTSAGQ